MMDIQNEIKDYLENNLKIRIDAEEHWDGGDMLCVELYLDDRRIDYDYVDIKRLIK